MTTPVRWRLEGRLVTRSPLHIGSGETVTRPELVVEIDGDSTRLAEVSAVAVDHRGQAYLPGSAIKGALRSWIRDHLPGSEERARGLFGDEDTRPLEERRKTGSVSVGGKAEFWNALRAETPEPDPAPPHWDPTRATGVRAFVTLDRRTKTVARERLFHEELVPPGVAFDFVIAGQGLSDEDIELLLAALDHGFDGQSAAPLALGAGAANGDGRLTLETLTLRRLGPDDVAEWLKVESHAGFAEFPEVPDLAERRAAARQRWAPAHRERLALGLAITFDSPFAVGSAARAAGEEAGRQGARLPALDERGLPVLPGSSIRGALRSQAEKILRTLGVRVCDPGSPAACKPVRTFEDVPKLCPACRLFGAAGWGTAVDVTDFRVVGQAPERHSQEHLAIDRFTGGVAGRRKFKSESYSGVQLTGQVVLDRERTADLPWAAGLLALVLRDLIEGDVPLGHGSARGFGAARAQLTEPAAGLAALETEVNIFRNHLAKLRPQKPPSEPAALHSPLASSLPETGEAPVSRTAKRVAAGADEFHNPYHFVPLPSAGQEDPESLSVDQFGKGDTGAVTHDRYVPGTFSGRITFQVRTETPTVLGGEQVPPANPQGSATVQPFELDGEPAIPGSSLRGLLSSLVEAVTGSALRVLEDTSYSVRSQMGDSLPALGRLVDEGAGRLKLEPMALPHFPWNSGDATQREIDRWRSLFPHQPVLKVYISGDLRHRLKSTSSAGSETFWLKLGSLPRWTKDLGFGLAPNQLQVKQTKRGEVLVAQRSLDFMAPLTTDQLNRKFPESDPERKKFVPGVLRILDFEKHESEIPRDRKHEIFIPTPPLPQGAEPVRLDIGGPLADFHRLAAERARPKDSYLPFGLKGAPRVDGDKMKLRAGDLVWFDIDGSGKVKRLALSSIWREGKGKAFDYFADHRELLPFHPDRAAIDTAERLFGFVEEGEIPESRSAHALASRVRVENGRLLPERSGAKPWYVCPAPRPLVILGSPKPPSPALYFRDPESRRVIRKRELNANAHEPQGRKFYLHQRQGAWFFRGGPSPDDKEHLRVLARPLRTGLVFESHLDFDNLTERELALLVYALRPTPSFRHKLGLGKPLGLGTVEVSPLRLERVDRLPRYERDALTAPRHEAGTVDLELLRDRLRATLAPALRDALELLGDPAAVTAPVQYPEVFGQKEREENFHWFVRNEDHREHHPQGLAPIAASHIGEGALPTLEMRPPFPRTGEGHRGSGGPSSKSPASGHRSGPRSDPPRSPPSSSLATLGDRWKVVPPKRKP